MNTDHQNEESGPASNKTVWAFDAGNVPRPSDGRGWRAATGEGCNWPDEFPSPRWGDLSRLGNGERSSAEPKARSGPSEQARVSQRVRRTDEVNLIFQFLHKASLLIPAEFAETKTAAGRRRMWRTRQAHGSSRNAFSFCPSARRRSSARSSNATRPLGGRQALAAGGFMNRTP